MRLLVLTLFACSLPVFAQTPAQDEFFESKVRPILVTRCGSCHGETMQMKGVQLTSRDAMHASGVVTPGDPAASKLVQVVRYDGKVKMPPTGKLPDAEIATLEKWIADGALWPAKLAAAPALKASSYWAFQPVKKPAPPVVKDTAWPRTEIDRFILAKLEEKQLRPVRDANKNALLRRVTLDLTGLLPTPAETEAFLKDASPEAFATVVDRLLASPAFGDAWGRHWLDVTYYADTTGVGRRIPLPEAWRYRDYVIQSFNEDKPYDRFVREQIAGTIKSDKKDKKQPEDNEAAAATGFLVLGPWAWFSYDRAQLRLDVADLQTDLVGRTFLGLTVGCARCHDHKFDPIPNKDYYGLVGIFLSTQTLSKANSQGGINTVDLPETTEDVHKYAARLDEWETRMAKVEAFQKTNSAEQTRVKKELEELKAKPKSPDTETAIKTTEAELDTLKKATGPAGDKQILPFTRYLKPKEPYAYAAEDMEFPEDARIAVRGDAHQLGSFTPRKFLTAVSYEKQPVIDPQKGSGREELAEWIADEKNPLTARVYVNRLWHYLFGDGIVPTTENFGSSGERPTNQELLDYLAARLVENGWSTKKTIREIVLSRVYQLSSVQDPKSSEIDGDNKLLWRANRRRLDAEAIRDTVLQVSGHLDRSRGGPSLPLTAENVHTIAPFFLEDDSVIEDNVKYRRTVYQPIMRNSQMEGIDILNLFDFKDPDQVVGSRISTTVPTQMLFLMNSPFIKEESRFWAARLLADLKLDDAGRVSSLIETSLNRPATDGDRRQSSEFVAKFVSELHTAGAPMPENPRLEAWTRYCQAVFVSSEFLYRR